MAPSALPAPTSVCISSMNRMMPPSDDVTSCSTALSRSSNSPRYLAPAISAPMSSASSFLSCQAFRHVAVDDAQRQALDDRGLADAGLADQHRIVLGAPREHLDGAANFLVAADDRIELAVARGLGEIARIFLERIIGVLGRSGVGGAALAQRIDGGVEVLRRHAGAAEDLAGLAVLLERERQQQPLDRDIAVAGLLGDLLGLIEHARRGRARDRAGRRRRRRLSAFWRARPRRAASASRERPPERSISPAARPSGSSSRTLSRCSGANCWCPSRSASDWADCTKPRARSVYFSTFMVASSACSNRPAGTEGTSSSVVRDMGNRRRRWKGEYPPISGPAVCRTRPRRPGLPARPGLATRGI